MRRVVYVIGAGFSVPLGLPTIATFLDRAKTQYVAKSGQFAHFADVFKAIREIAACRRYTDLDLENIEDILSLVEMSIAVHGKATAPDYELFIRDVILHHTAQHIPGELGQDWVQNVFGAPPWGVYGAFAAALHPYTLVRNSSEKTAETIAYRADPSLERDTRYAVITLNYDLALEEAIRLVRDRLGVDTAFQRPNARNALSDDVRSVPLVKLHGSVDKGPIVPPTWSKGLRDEDIHAQWIAAYRLLRDAQDIRILGYSLPENDAYIRFLIRSALMDSIALQNIHVLCLDDDRARVKQRYRSFFSYSKLAFLNGRIESYLESMTRSTWPWAETFGSVDIERTHSAMFSSALA